MERLPGKPFRSETCRDHAEDAGGHEAKATGGEGGGICKFYARKIPPEVAPEQPGGGLGSEGEEVREKPRSPF
jgi:hypothetical protein